MSEKNDETAAVEELDPNAYGLVSTMTHKRIPYACYLAPPDCCTYGCPEYTSKKCPGKAYYVMPISLTAMTQVYMGISWFRKPWKGGRGPTVPNGELSACIFRPA